MNAFHFKNKIHFLLRDEPVRTSVFICAIIEFENVTSKGFLLNAGKSQDLSTRTISLYFVSFYLLFCTSC